MPDARTADSSSSCVDSSMRFWRSSLCFLSSSLSVILCICSNMPISIAETNNEKTTNAVINVYLRSDAPAEG